ncbi:MAG: tetratricopeptide repeat protein [Cyanobacteriota bacterium]|nr:tetratricopeptide repeat protein [Cyanobacteriota bacterium]
MVQTNFKTANQLLRSGKLDDAVAAYREAIALNPGFSYGHHNLGEALVKVGRIDEAIAAFRQAVAINPQASWSLYKLGVLLQGEGQFQEALGYLRRAVEQKTDVPEFYLGLGGVLVKLGQWSEAEQCLDKVVNMLYANAGKFHGTSLQTEAYYYLGAAKSGQQQWSEAVEFYRRSWEMSPGGVDCCLGLAEALGKLGQWSEAVEFYRQAVALSGESGEVLFGLGQALGQLGRWDEAVVEYGRAISLGFAGAEVRHHLGYALGQLGRWEEAVVEYRQVLEVNPKSAVVRHQLGYGLMRLGRWREAEVELRKVLEVNPKSAVVWQQLGDVLRELGERNEAVEVDRQARELNPYIDLEKNKLINTDYSNFEKATTSRIAVCVHVFYEHIWNKISRYLGNLTKPYDIFITCPTERCYAVSAIVHQTHPEAIIEGVQNVGMDVAPFIHSIKKFDLWSYDLVLKLHTKNDRSVMREEQGNILFQGTLGSTDLVHQILSAFSTDDELGMVGPDYLYRSAQYLMYGNREFVDKFRKALRIQNHQGDWGFFSGTMFWIRGSILQNVADASRSIMNIFASSEVTTTGGDGTAAHAFERLFGLLPTANGMTTGLTYRCNYDATEFLLQTPETQNLKQPLRYACTTDRLMCSNKAQKWAAIVEKSDLFDRDYYLASRKDMLEVARRNPALHFVLYGDAEGYDPCQKFSTAYYHLRYKDIRHRQLPALVHYMMHGMKEGRQALPSKEDWLELAEQENLFFDAWYEKTIEANLNGVSPKQSYMTYGWLQLHPTSKNFNPRLLPVVNNACQATQIDPLEFYLSEYALSEYALYDVLSRACKNQDFYIVPEIVEQLHRNFGETRASLEALGTSLILEKRWSQARSVWGKVWHHFLNASFVERYRASVVQYDTIGANRKNNFRNLDISLSCQRDLNNYRVCIYTSLYGDRDDLLPMLSTATGIDYICFTDRLRDFLGWEFRVVDPGFNDNNLNAKIFKILPHIYLQEYDYSLFVDANTLFLGRISDLIKKCSGSDFVMWKHPVRNDVYLEIATIMAHRRHGPDGLIEQIEAYASSCLPRKSGMVEGSFIWRKHNNKTIASFMDEWWQHIKQYTRRDQVSLGYLMWRNGLHPSVLPDELGTSRENVYFKKMPHKKGLYEGNSKTIAVSNYKSLSFKNADILFLFSPRFAGSGATIMRGKQLSSLVRPKVLDNRQVIYTSNDDVSGKILFLTKGYLQSSTPELLESLKKRDNIIIADFVDGVVEKEIMDSVDVLVAASLSAYLEYREKWHQKQIHYITHHTDPRISNVRSDEFNKTPRIGYFGEIANTVKSNRIAELVDFYRVDTSCDNSTSWLNYVSEYNCHYAARRTRKQDGHKPFTKGFVAAKCDANIIVQESVTDVKYYLGVDYPYLLPDNPDEVEIVYMLQRVLTEYGGREWNYGLEIMREVRERSSPDRVISDFNNLLSCL